MQHTTPSTTGDAAMLAHGHALSPKQEIPVQPHITAASEGGSASDAPTRGSKRKWFARPLARLGLCAALIAAAATGAMAVTYAAEMVEGVDYGVMSTIENPSVAIEVPKSVAMTVEKTGDATASAENNAEAGDTQDTSLYLGYLNATGTYSNISSVETSNDTRNKTVRVQAPEVSEAAQLLGVSTTLAGGAAYVDIAPGATTDATTSQNTLAQIVATVAVPEERHAPIKSELQRLVEASGVSLPSRTNALGDYTSSFCYTYFPAETSVSVVGEGGTAKSVYNKYNVLYAQLENVPAGADVVVEWWTVDWWTTASTKVGEGLTYTVLDETWAVRPVLVDKSGTYATPLTSTNYYRTDVFDVFAMYSESDNSLRFYRDNDAPAVGSEYDGRTVTAVDVSIDELDELAKYKTLITSVVVESDITFPAASMDHYFDGYSKVDTFDLLKLDVSGVTSMEALFYNCTSARYFDITTWDVSNVTNFSYFMQYCVSVVTLNLTGFSATSAQDTSRMFASMSSLTTIYVRQATWTMPAVEELASSEQMFGGSTRLVGGVGTAYSASYLDAEYARIDTPETPGYLTDHNVATSYMAVYSETDNSLRFYGAGEVPMIGDLLDGRRVTAIDTSIETLDGVAAYKSKIKKIVVMEQMQFPMTNLAQYFSYYTACTLVDLRNLDVSNVTSFNHTFWYSYNIRTIIVSEANWDTSSVTDFENMFHSTTNLRGGCGTGYNSSYISGQYAVIDKPGQPGYLTVDEYEASSFAVYSDDDKSIRLYGAGRVPLPDEVFDGRTVTGVDADLTKLDGMAAYRSTAKSITVMEAIQLPTSDMTEYFYNFSTVETIDLTLLDFSNITTMYYAFAGNSKLTQVTFGSSDTSAVTNMSYLFYYCTSLVAADFENLDVSGVQNFCMLFGYCSSIEDAGLAGIASWNTASATNMQYLFYCCTKLTGEGLSFANWDTSNVKNFDYTFSSCTALKVLDLEPFDTSSTVTASYMFYNSYNLTTIYASELWDFTQVSEGNSYAMFYLCNKLVGGCGTPYYYPTSSSTYWPYINKCVAVLDKVGQEGYLTQRGYESNSYAVYTQGDESVRFYAGNDAPSIGDVIIAPSGEELTVTLVDRSLDKLNAFRSLNYQPLVFTVESDYLQLPTTTLDSYFMYFYGAKSYDLTGLDTTGVTSTRAMFMYSWAATSITLGEGFDTSAVTNMNSMFYQCCALTELDIANFDTSNVTDMAYLFYDCRAIGSDVYDFTNWDVSNVTNFTYMFACNYALTELNLEAFDTSSAVYANYMFYESSKLETIYVDESLWDMSGVAEGNSYYMFYNCKALTGGCGTPYSYPSNSSTYYPYINRRSAVVDKVSQEGYLTSRDYESESFAVLGDDNVIRIYATGYTFPVEGEAEAEAEAEATLHTAAYVASDAENTENNGELGDNNAENNGELGDNTNNAGNGGNLDVTPDTSDSDNTGDISTPGDGDGLVRAPKPGDEFDGVIVKAVDRSIERLNAFTNYRTYVTALYTIDEVVFPGTTMYEWMRYYYNAKTVDLEKMDLTSVTSFEWAFSSMYSLESITFKRGTTRNVTNFYNAFSYMRYAGYSTPGAIDMRTLDVSGATTLYGMFYYLPQVTTIDVSTWDVSKVENFQYLFASCPMLEALNLEGWSPTSAKYMDYMFNASSKLATIYVDDAWELPSVASSSGMFTGCTALAGGAGTVVSSVVNATYAVADTMAAPGYLTNVAYETGAFAVYTSDNVVRVYADTALDGDAYDNAGYLEPEGEEPGDGEESSLSPAGFSAENATAEEDVPEADDAENNSEPENNGEAATPSEDVWTREPFYMPSVNPERRAPMVGEEFEGRTVLAVDRTLNKLDGFASVQSKVVKVEVVDEVSIPATSLYEYFARWYALEEADLVKADFSLATDASYMFYYSYKLSAVTFKEGTTSNVTNTSYMFAYCYGLGDFDATSIDVSSVTDAYAMFYGSNSGANSLRSLDVSTWNTTKMQNVAYMFAACPYLVELDLTGFNLPNVTNANYMFASNTALTTIYIDSERWKFPAKATQGVQLYATFDGCTNLRGGCGTAVTAQYGTGGAYAVSDEIGQPGYLTDATYTTQEYAVYTAEDKTVRLYGVSGLGLTDDKNSPNYVFATAPKVGEKDGAGRTVTAVDRSLDKLDAFYSYKNYSIERVVSEDAIALPAADCSNWLDYAYYLTSVDLSKVDLSKVQKLDGFFYYNYQLKEVTFKQQTSSVCTSMRNMFYYCYGLETLDLSALNTSNVTDMYGLFLGCTKLTELNVAGWDTSNVTNLDYAFYSLQALTELDLTGWNVSNVESFYYTWYYCPALTTVYVDDGWKLGENVNLYNSTFWGTKLVGGCGTSYEATYTYVGGYYYGTCYAVPDLEDQPGYFTLRGYTTSKFAIYSETDNSVRLYHNNDTPQVGEEYRGRKVTAIDRSLVDLYGLYQYKASATSIVVEETLELPGEKTSLNGYFSAFTYVTSMDLRKLDVSRVTTLANLFQSNGYLQTLNLAGWDVSNVTSLSYTFSGATALTSLDVSGWDTSNVTNMEYVFYGANKLTSLDLSSWDTSNVTNMAGMFYAASSLVTVDFSSASTHNLVSLVSFLESCSALRTFYVDNARWNIKSTTSTTWIFWGTSGLVGGLGTTYISSDALYARADMPEQPGYFTHKTASVAMANPPVVEEVEALNLGALALSAGLVATGRVVARRKQDPSAA
jgi:surface protein